MKGPYQRLKHDLRRVWECPVCRYRAATAGSVTALLCRCQEAVDPRSRQFMRLLEPVLPTRRPLAPPLPEGEVTNPPRVH